MENIFLTCCVLHNILLDYDGLGEHTYDDNWDHLDGNFGVPEEDSDEEEEQDPDEIFDAEQVGSIWGNATSTRRVVIEPDTDYSATGRVQEDEEVEPEIEPSFEELRKYLIENFTEQSKAKAVRRVLSERRD